jgi:hypothetical protein
MVGATLPDLRPHRTLYRSNFHAFRNEGEPIA